MNILNEYETKFDEIATKLKGGNIGILDKIALLWQQRQILNDWERCIERCKNNQ